MKKRSRLPEMIALCISGLALLGLFYLLSGRAGQTQKVDTAKASSALLRNDQPKGALPKVKSSDWELVLVNRDHPKEELNPDLATVDGVEVDKRIEKAVSEFLAAAQAINPQVHLISGYRSVDYQTVVYQGYVEQEMAARGIDQAAAEKIVQTYSQPAGSSEHQTGLAIDMSTVDSLNENDPELVKELEKIAPDYGFVLRFWEDKKMVTGIGYEDWHFRYVGRESAKYMTENHLALEEYLEQLKEAGQK